MKPPKRLKAGVPGKKRMFVCSYLCLHKYIVQTEKQPIKKKKQSSWKSKNLELKEPRISNRTPFLCSQGCGSLHYDGGNKRVASNMFSDLTDLQMRRGPLNPVQRDHFNKGFCRLSPLQFPSLSQTSSSALFPSP